MTVIDQFAGAGGWDVAARRLGLDPIGFEIDAAANKTRLAAGLKTDARDVAAIDLAEFGWPVTGLIASPPCQGFSGGGKGKGRQDWLTVSRAANLLALGVDRREELAADCTDHRSMLVVEPLRWTLALRPQWVCWEQVPTVLPFWAYCAELLAAVGYSTWTGYLHAEQFGVPQTRKRAFLIASRVGPVGPPTPTHSKYHARDKRRLDHGVLPWVSMARALGWESGTRAYRLARGEGMTERHGARPDTPDDTPAPTISTKARSASWVFERPSTTVSCDPRISNPGRHDPNVSGSQQAGAIRVTPEEAAVLQSFPADFPWQGSRTKQFEQIGNAVPPGLALPVIEAALAAGALEQAA